MAIGSQLTILWREVLSQPPPSTIPDLWKEHLRILSDFNTFGLANNKRRTESKDRVQQLPVFLKWCEKRNIQHSDLEIRQSQHGFCLSTTKPVEEGQIVANVPMDAIFSTDSAENIDSLKKLLENDELVRTMDNVALAVSLAHEVLRGPESEWAEYFNILPIEFETPIFYTEQQLQALKPSPLFEEALGMYRAVARQFVYFYLRIIGDVGEKGKKQLANTDRLFAGSPFTLQNFSFDFYRWCVSVVSTRINMVPSKRANVDGSPKMIPALIPFIDMANHAHLCAKPASVYFEAESKSAKMQLNSGLQGNQEVFIHYGPRSNAKFLLHNGFLPELPNPDDIYELKIGLARSTPNFDAKWKSLSTHSIFPITKQSQHHNPVYLFQLKPEPLVDTLKRSSLWTFAKIYVSADNLETELDSTENIQKAQKFLYNRFNLIIHGYETAHQHQSQNEFLFGNINRLKQEELTLLDAYLSCIRKIGDA